MKNVSSTQTTSQAQKNNDNLLINAHRRIDEMEFNDSEHEFIWADWDNMTEHIEWLQTASRAEIKRWIDANY